jgi:hypothetical protein
MLEAVPPSARRGPRRRRALAGVAAIVAVALAAPAVPGPAAGDAAPGPTAARPGAGAPWVSDAVVRQALPRRDDVRLLRAADADDAARRRLLAEPGSSFVHCGDFRARGAPDCAVVGHARRADGEPLAFVAILSRAGGIPRVEFLRELETDFAVLAILPAYRDARDVILVRFVHGSDLDRGIAWNGSRYESLPE